VTGVYDSPIIRFITRVQAPILQMFALYVLIHGHYSPGGAFQAGAVLAGSFLLPRIVEGQEKGQHGLSTRGATWMACIGTMLFAGTGVAMLLMGGAGFLDYDALQLFGLPPGPSTRAIGSLFIEFGVAMTVMGVMVIIYDDVVAPKPEIPEPEDAR
jgi:multicomponent Na+:H+ antiporter subunit B